MLIFRVYLYKNIFACACMCTCVFMQCVRVCSYRFTFLRLFEYTYVLACFCMFICIKVRKFTRITLI